MTDSKTPSPPAGMRAAGRKLWRSIQRDYALEDHETVLLIRACRVADACADLQKIVDDEGPMMTDRFGQTVTHPATVELRQQSQLLARLIVALRVPLGDQDGASTARSQRRGIRGTYGIRGAV